MTYALPFTRPGVGHDIIDLWRQQGELGSPASPDSRKYRDARPEQTIFFYSLGRCPDTRLVSSRSQDRTTRVERGRETRYTPT